MLRDILRIRDIRELGDIRCAGEIPGARDVASAGDIASARARGAAWLSMVALVCAESIACTEFEPGTDELGPEMVTQQQFPAPGPGRDWSCLSAAEPPPMLLRDPAGERLVQSLQILNLATGQVIPNVSVRACSQRDVECTTPLTENIPLDAQGWVDVPLFEGFDGFLEVTGESLMPTVLFYADPLAPGSEVDHTPLALVELALLPALSGATGTPQELTRGLVVLRSFDCRGDAAPGVTFSIDKPGVPWYFVGGLPSSTAVATAPESGLGGFINVEPGIAVVNAALPGSPLPIAAAKSVLVRPGWMTAMRFLPQPE